MRKFIFPLTALFVILFLTQHVNAQISATAETTAKIVSGLQITKEADLNFGSMFSPRNGGGTVTVDVNNQRAATGVQLATVTGESITAAQFKVTGDPNATFTITFPYSFSVINTDGSGSSMLVDNFTYNSITSPSTLDGNGEKIIKIGATLHVYNYQALGTYKNTTDLKITVAYY
ncbi:DUF4402 domain-containing protein [Anaerorudis cellulosivorans]|uniref:DUF4402 domain-containing protein n=1 Tax=Anaerorudis cellulosivorans TaxID=3397862 RepID=UPI0022210FDE|nr:DUF4402 domain-containing protein [Seramator thermalis]MCW1735315.1 DUF4402 domain-containing protein [Seramator thermalis]